MKIAITGATGLVGRALARRLVDERHEVTVLTRDVVRAERILPAGCRFELWQPQGEPNPFALRDVGAVVHLAGEGIADGRWTAARKRAIRDSRVIGTRALVRAIEALPAQKRPSVFVSASAVGYYGDRAGEDLDESAAPGNGFLSDVCRAWEAEALAASRLGPRAAVLRFGVVLAREGGALQRMLPPFRLGLGGRLGPGEQWMSWIHLADLTALIATVLDDRAAEGAINAVSPAPVTNAQFTAELARVLGRRALLPVPATVLRLALGEMSEVLLASQKVHPRAALDLGLRFGFPEIAGALADLTSDPSRTIEREIWLPGAPEEVFAFFSDARNLERITPGFLHFRVLGTSTPTIREGTTIDYKLRLHGVPLRWRSRIDEFRPGRGFVDRQEKGPYALWHHTHEFEPRDGGTLVRDRVRYRLPFGVLGELVASSRVARDLEQIFAFRTERMREIFPARAMHGRAAGRRAS